MPSGLKKGKTVLSDSPHERNQGFIRQNFFLFLLLFLSSQLAYYLPPFSSSLLHRFHPELPSLTVSSQQFSFSYDSFYSNTQGLILSPILHGCRLQINTDCPPRHPDGPYAPALPPELCRCFINANPCFPPPVRIFQLLCPYPVFITFMFHEALKKKKATHSTV